MAHPKDLRISDFSYELPDDRIALHPLPERDASKLLLHKAGTISEKVFRDLATEIPAGTLVVFNDTRVIRARLHFRRESGALVELFCTESIEPFPDFSRTLGTTDAVLLRAFVGNGKRWKTDETLKQEILREGKTIAITAQKIEPVDDQWTIRLAWDDETLSLAELLDAFGEIPLPPYLNRDEELEDAERYQTIFAAHNGSVAAPTASLHFTPAVIESLQQKGVALGQVTLHVGAGTFKPVKSERMQDHLMHREQLIITRDLIELVIAHINTGIVAAGTTSMRTLESIYWFGYQLTTQPGRAFKDLFVDQWEPYQATIDVPVPIALRAVRDWMIEHNKSMITGETKLLIAPGYRFRIVTGLITNFHQPESTLLLLVAAFTGTDFRSIYDYALAHEFRFLSYGDSSLLWRN